MVLTMTDLTTKRTHDLLSVVKDYISEAVGKKFTTEKSKFGYVTVTTHTLKLKLSNKDYILYSDEVCPTNCLLLLDKRLTIHLYPKAFKVEDLFFMDKLVFTLNEEELSMLELSMGRELYNDLLDFIDFINNYDKQTKPNKFISKLKEWFPLS